MQVTIAIPFHNNERTLEDAIRSVFAQTFTDWELILLDDGSSDNSLEIARAVMDPRVRVIQDGKVVGLPGRLNQSAKLARGHYLARMDADDIMHPERIANQLRHLEEHSHIDLLGTATYSIDEKNNVIGKRGVTPLDTRPISVFKRCAFIHPTIMGRTEWFLKNPYNEAFLRAQDYELWCRVCTTSRLAVITQPLFFYREVGVFNLQRYKMSSRYLRRIFRNYGPSAIGWFRTATLIAKSYSKEWVYMWLTQIGKENLLIANRNRKLVKAESVVATKVIQRITTTHVPGLTLK